MPRGNTNEITIVFIDEDYPNKIIDLLYDIYRFFKWGRIYDIETFHLIDDKLVFSDTYCNSDSYFQLDDLHEYKEMKLEEFEKLNNEPLVYVSTWNHMFSSKSLKNTDYVTIELKYPKRGSRIDVEKIYSWKENNRLFTSLILSFLTILLVFLTTFSKRYRKVNLTFKVLTISCIALIALINSDGLDYLIFVGLVFGLLGDILLEFENKFLVGMISFLVGHVIYSVSFGILFGVPKISIFLICFLIVFSLYFLLLFRNLGNMKVPVAIYTLAITFMLVFSLSPLFSKVPYVKIFLPTAGILFVLSDFLISYDKFVEEIKYRNFLVLFSYFIAQLFIALTTVFV